MNAEFLTLAILVLLFSVIVHEVMHGLVALYFGDHTAENAGRLTLNPIPHIDPIGTILLPALFIFIDHFTGSGILLAWAKPVPVNPLNFRDIRRGELLVSLAGVGSNFALALLGTLFYHLAVPTIGADSFITQVLQFMVTINLTLGLFNLLPIPPLDGSNALITILPYNLARSYQSLSRYGFLILLALLYLNVIGLILTFILYPILGFLGVPPL